MSDTLPDEPEAGWSLPRLRFSPPNPFYLLSAAAFLHATGIWAGQQGRELPDQTRLALIGSYLVAMALTALLIVRAWKQWADARSVVLIVLLLFAELALSFDDAVLRDPSHGGLLLAIALGVAVGVSELLFRGLRLTFPTRYRAPYYVQMTLLFLFPLVLAGPARASDFSALRLQLYAFSWIAAGSIVLLVAAVYAGARGLEETGTPWKWPMYPWPAFVFLGICLAARTFAQCLAFDSASSIDTQTALDRLPSAFGPHFVAPFVLAIGVLLYAAADRAGRTRSRNRVLGIFSAASIVLSFNAHDLNPMSRDLLATLGDRLAAPPQLMIVVLAVLATVAALRGDRRARLLLVGLGLLQMVIDGRTIDLWTLTPPRPAVLAVVAFSLTVVGLARRRSAAFVAGGAAAIAAAESAGQLSNAFAPEAILALHALIAVLLIGGFAFDDRHTVIWKRSGALLLLVAELLVSATHAASPTVSLLYVAIIGATALAIARARGDLVFAGLAAFSLLMLEVNGVWLGVTVLETRLAWRGAPLLLVAWGLLLSGLHVSAWKGGAVLSARRWLLGLPSEK